MTPKKINYIFFIFFILTQKVLIRLLLYLTCKLLYPPYEVRTGGCYGLVVVTPRPRPQTLHRSHDNLKNPYRIASIFYM